MSSREDREWNDGPVYRPTFRTPTFVKEVGLAQNKFQSTTLPDKETLDRGERVRNIYQSLAASWSSDIKEDLEVIDLCEQDDKDDAIDDNNNNNNNNEEHGSSSDGEIQFVKCVRPQHPLVNETSSSTLDPSVATVVTGDKISDSSKSATNITSANTAKRSSAQTPGSQWFIRHALTTTTPTNQFSLMAPPSGSTEASQRTSLASLIDLPDPGNGPAFVPPPHFHIKPGNKGYDMLKTLGWSGRGLGKIAAVTGSASAGTTGSEKRVLVAEQDQSIGSTKRSRNTIPQTSSDSSSSSSDESPFNALPSPPRLSSSSNAPFSGPVSPSSRRTLIAPISTTLKSDLLGIRPSSSTGGHHRAITHTAQSIKLANRDSALAEGRMGPKATRRKVERERKERLELMARLNR